MALLKIDAEAHQLAIGEGLGKKTLWFVGQIGEFDEMLVPNPDLHSQLWPLEPFGVADYRPRVIDWVKFSLSGM